MLAMRPVIGLSAIRVCSAPLFEASGCMYTVGVANIHTWTRNGTARRGKYTLLMSRSETTTLVPAVLIDAAKNVHGRRPANANSGYGTSPDGSPATRLKKIVKTTIIISGCRTAHAAPSTVCL